MGNGVHIPQKSKVRSHNKKNKEESVAIASARFVHDFSIAITLPTGQTRLINFLPLFQKYVKGENLKYYAPDRFNKFIIKNGNIYWGRNEDVIFPVSILINKEDINKKNTEEILYII